MIFDFFKTVEIALWKSIPNPILEAFPFPRFMLLELNHFFGPSFKDFGIKVYPLVTGKLVLVEGS